MSGCQTRPSVPLCNCDQAEAELRAYAEKYLEMVEDNGNLRQKLEACQEN